MTTVIDLRDALIAARPVLFGEAMDAANALLAALTPPMEEPMWPEPAVMAKCSASASAHTLHVRSPARGKFRWTCWDGAFRWEDLIDPRPLTDEERAKYGIPGECDRPHAEPITDALVERCINAADDAIQEDWLWRDVSRAILRAAGHPEAGE